jgi:hypothetical protein
MSANGDAEEFKKANNMLMYWWLGVGVAILSYVAVKVIVNLF